MHISVTSRGIGAIQCAAVALLYRVLRIHTCKDGYCSLLLSHAISLSLSLSLFLSLSLSEITTKVEMTAVPTDEQRACVLDELRKHTAAAGSEDAIGCSSSSSSSSSFVFVLAYRWCPPPTPHHVSRQVFVR